MSNALSLHPGWWKLASTQSRSIIIEEDREYRSLIHAELGFEADGGVAPEWLPERSHDSSRQSNAAVDIGLSPISNCV